jgi:Bacterial SCP ortholog
MVTLMVREEVNMPGPKPDPEGEANVGVVAAALDRGDQPDKGALRSAARFLLQELARVSPGRSVEIRVVPVAAVQAVAGPRHTRGTPPNVVETDPETWFRLATGRLNWDEALRSGAVRASGARSDLSAFLPLT